MIKSDKLYNATNSLIIGAILILLGILMIIGRSFLYVNFVNIFLLAILFLSMKQFLSYFLSKNKGTHRKIKFTKSFFYLVFCLIFSLFKNIPLSILPLVFGLYLLLNSIIKITTYCILAKTKSNGRIIELTLGLIYLVLSIPVIVAPIKNLDMVLLFIGIYFILLGVNYVVDFITFLIPRKTKTKLRRSFRISLPVFIEAVIPYVVLNEINYLLNKDDYEDGLVYVEKKTDAEPDIEVFVHTARNSFNRLGHVDIYYKGRVISYGAYDIPSRRFFDMVGDGTVFTTTKEKYIPFCIKTSDKTIFSFGLKLTELQKKSIDKQIETLFEGLYEWNTPYAVALSENKKVKKKDFMDYSSKLYYMADAKFYKFKSGKFKRFFVLGVNCCYLADYILGKSGIDLLKMTGVITPGAYYEYLNREFMKKGSMVISREIYNQENINKTKKSKRIFNGLSSQ